MRLVKYSLVGLSNTVVSFAVLNLFFFLWPPVTQAILVAGSTAAYAAGDVNSFWWNKHWTFGGGNNHRTQIVRFALVSIVCMAINAAVVWGAGGFLLSLFLPAWLIANLQQVSMAVSGSVGYIACRNWVFRGQLI